MVSAVSAEARLEGLAVMLKQVMVRLDRIELEVSGIGELVRLNIQALDEEEKADAE